ncbi:hypothetical protein E8E12_011737 [Didymella heteroderae]|uniref:Uncharacterized protein n=1 Tax=Didymella heteroderae TaxID=1769908 RepID=A0A9P4X0Q4_9PLEO|nr:hypothetical protein E8E12_011737 [Didymella heteroderae]
MVKSNRWTRATAPHGILVDLYWPNAPPVWPTLTPRTDPPGTPFPFLSLPRELRDQVYFHILPPTLEYHQPTAKATKWWECDSGWWPPAPRRPVPHLPLLLACRQLHDEAQALLSLTTTISLPSYSRAKRYQNDERLPLHLLLCSFPSSLAGMVTRVSRSYPNYSRPWFGNFEINSAFDMWAYVVSESHILKEHLPRLRRFEAKEVRGQVV